MAQFNLDDYEPVEERIKKFYKDWPDGRVRTSIIADDGKRVVIKAYLYRDHEADRFWSTGYAEEVRGEGFVNKTSALENCETSAIGRALANANYAGSKRPSKEEMQKVERSKAIEISATEVKTSDLSGGITDAQRIKIMTLFKAYGINTDDNRHKALDRFVGKTSVNKLTKNEASTVINTLEGLIDEGKTT